MIAKKLYYTRTEEFDDRVLVGVYVDRELIGIMQNKIRDEIEDVAVFQHKDTDDPDEIDDSLNYLRDLIASYKVLSEVLEDIACAEGVSKIPPDDDNE